MKTHPKSQTTPRLYQHPVIKPKPTLDWADIFRTAFKNICAGAVVAACFFAIALIVFRGYADAAEPASVVEYQFKGDVK
ncbi:hypothetical protein [Acinetobacter chinensis]|uniref:hypothetical protein n=1 Tax=Acinetobacter chinensis TaxID=2004650 RepID=UPI00293459E0|nr:hypothetical protein [Acinetobacter chinensis]WOE40739.1 hypothetical protein QSG87_12705 [Acinetobacter chinensis]